jgi:vacuolar iron transporter family protein
MLNLLREQKNEITAHHIYQMLAKTVKSPENAAILQSISSDELKHYDELRKITKTDLQPSRLKIAFHYIIAKFLGLTFGIKLLEKAELKGIADYKEVKKDLPVFTDSLKDEESHENLLIAMIDEEKLKYVGSVVLGLNDALVELTGALAGFTFAFQNTRLIAVTGLITGISASLSMSASEYISTIQDTGQKERSLKSALYTGIAYVVTVMLLILPYLILANPFISLAICLAVAVLIILMFNYYVSVAKGAPFRKRFVEMVAISLGVSAISFVIGILVKNVFGVNL